ncbi:UNVERIFIED_CONTAM: ABC transporter permease subunit [Halobacillus marinus]
MKSFRTKILWLLLPSLLFLVMPFYGLVNGMIQSLMDDGSVRLTHYKELADNGRFISSISFSVQTAFLATSLSMVIGLVMTKYFYTYLKKTSSRLLVWIPMLFPHFVWGYVVLLLLSESGVAAQALTSFGLLAGTEAFPIWTRDPNGIGIIITYVWKELPLVILLLFPVYAGINREYYDLVETMGGSGWQKFKTVDMPSLTPVLIETFLIVFAFTLSAYEVPALLGTTYPEMAAVLSYDWFYGSSWDDRPLAFAAMISISLLLLALAVVGYAFVNRRRWRRAKGESL